jgi:hypothetical protein
MSNPAARTDVDRWNDIGRRGELIARAFEGARLACGVAACDSKDGYPARVRVLAAAALFRGQFLPAKAAARDCAVGDQSRISPSRVGAAGVTDSMVDALIEFLGGGEAPEPTADPRPGTVADQARALRDGRLSDAERLYVEEGRSITETGELLNPPLSPAATWELLKSGGIPTRPRGAQSRQYRAGVREKPQRPGLRRFGSPQIDPSQATDLRADHPALADGRTIFPSTVVGSRESPALLVSGHNNPKLGKEVLKGDRAGWPIFHLTLEERATCPRSCPVWAGCYGNGMHRARRHRADAQLLRDLPGAVAAKAKMYPGGFLVRLHTLGDFFSVEYVLLWAELLAAHPALHVFGYTARRLDDADPETRKIAQAIALLTQHRWSRFAIRTSHGEFGPQRSVVVMEDPGRPDVLMCPAQAKATEACATCGLCWAEAPRDKAIGFLKHGMKRPRGRRRAEAIDGSSSRNPAGETIPSDQGGARPAEAVTGDPPVASAAIINDGSGLKKEGQGNCQPRAEGSDRERSGDAMRRALYSPSPNDVVLRPAQPRRKPSVVTDRGRFVRMKPLNADIVRWSVAYVARGVSVDFLADLFDVDGEALGRAVAA